MTAATPLTDWPLRAALLPVLLTQALYIRRSARVLPEPPGPRTGSLPGAATRLLILGDSSAAGVGAARQADALSGQLPAALLPDVPTHWQTIARCGARTADALRWLDDAPPGPIDIAVTALGVNDVTKLTTLTQWRNRQSRLIDRLHAMGARHVYACGLPPIGHFPLLPEPLRCVLGRQAEAFEAALRDICAARPHARHVPFDFPMIASDMAPDGYHPGPVIYTAWARRIASAIRSDLAP